MLKWITTVLAGAVGALIATACWESRFALFERLGKFISHTGATLSSLGVYLLEKGGGVMLSWEHLLLPRIFPLPS